MVLILKGIWSNYELCSTGHDVDCDLAATAEETAFEAALISESFSATSSVDVSVDGRHSSH